jgi:NTE family protein
VLVVANGRRPGELPPRREAAYPSLAQIAGHALNSIFLDTLAVDLERLHRINRTIALLDPGELREAGVSLRHVDVFVIYPSEPIDMIAARHVAALPRSIRVLLRAVGATRRNGSNLASYLLFEAPFCRDLIDLGYRDTMRRRAELGAFFAGGAGESGPEVAADVRLRASC